MVSDIQAGDEIIEKLFYGVVYKENMASFKSTQIKYSKLKLFAFYSTDSNSALNFPFYDPHIECLQKKLLFPLLALFANFKAKCGQNSSKNKTNLIYRYVLESHFTSISGLGGFVLPKKVKIIVPL